MFYIKEIFRAKKTSVFKYELLHKCSYNTEI